VVALLPPRPVAGILPYDSRNPETQSAWLFCATVTLEVVLASPQQQPRVLDAGQLRYGAASKRAFYFVT